MSTPRPIKEAPHATSHPYVIQDSERYRFVFVMSLGLWRDHDRILARYHDQCTEIASEKILIDTLLGVKTYPFLQNFSDDRDLIILNSHGSQKEGNLTDLDSIFTLTPETLAHFFLKACPNVKHLKIKGLLCYGGTSDFFKRFCGEIRKNKTHPIEEFTFIGSDDVAYYDGNFLSEVRLSVEATEAGRTEKHCFFSCKAHLRQLVSEYSSQLEDKNDSPNNAAIAAIKIILQAESTSKELTPEQQIKIFTQFCNLSSGPVFTKLKEILAEDFDTDFIQFCHEKNMLALNTIPMLANLFKRDCETANKSKLICAANEIFKCVQSPQLRDNYIRLLFSFPAEIDNILSLVNSFRPQDNIEFTEQRELNIVHHLASFCLNNKISIANLLPLFLNFAKQLSLEPSDFRLLLEAVKNIKQIDLFANFLKILETKLTITDFLRVIRNIELFTDYFVEKRFHTLIAQQEKLDYEVLEKCKFIVEKTTRGFAKYYNLDQQNLLIAIAKEIKDHYPLLMGKFQRAHTTQANTLIACIESVSHQEESDGLTTIIHCLKEILENELTQKRKKKPKFALKDYIDFLNASSHTKNRFMRTVVFLLREFESRLTLIKSRRGLQYTPIKNLDVVACFYQFNFGERTKPEILLTQSTLIDLKERLQRLQNKPESSHLTIWKQLPDKLIPSYLTETKADKGLSAGSDLEKYHQLMQNRTIYEDDNVDEWKEIEKECKLCELNIVDVRELHHILRKDNHHKVIDLLSAIQHTLQNLPLAKIVAALKRHETAGSPDEIPDLNCTKTPDFIRATL